MGQFAVAHVSSDDCIVHSFNYSKPYIQKSYSVNIYVPVAPNYDLMIQLIQKKNSSLGYQSMYQ